MNPPHIATHDDLIVRISAEYLEMPGLRLTLPQALRLWGLDEPTCAAALETLLATKFLSRRLDGTYVRATDGQSPARFSMLKADLAAEAIAMPRPRVSRHQES